METSLTSQKKDNTIELHPLKLFHALVALQRDELRGRVRARNFIQGEREEEERKEISPRLLQLTRSRAVIITRCYPKNPGTLSPPRRKISDTRGLRVQRSTNERQREREREKKFPRWWRLADFISKKRIRAAGINDKISILPSLPPTPTLVSSILTLVRENFVFTGRSTRGLQFSRNNANNFTRPLTKSLGTSSNFRPRGRQRDEVAPEEARNSGTNNCD